MRLQLPPPDHDRLFKELLTTFFWEFLELFFPAMTPLLDRASLRFLDKEVFTDVTSGRKRVADVLAQVSWKEPRPHGLHGASGVRFLIHVENQSSAQAEIAKRMFQYFARLHEKHDVPVFPIVIFSYDHPHRAEPDVYRVAFPDGPVLDFHYRVIQLNRLNWRDFVEHENPVATALMVKMNVAPEDRVKVKLECLRLIVTLKLNPAKMQLISGFVDSYLRLSREENREVERAVQKEEPQQQEAMMEIMNSWMIEGVEKGTKQVVLRLLNRRFGPLTKRLEDRVRRLPQEQAEDLAEALLDFTSRKDLNAWLAVHK